MNTAKSIHIHGIGEVLFRKSKRAKKINISIKPFEGIVVSGAEKTRKPFQKIYDITLTRYNITPEKAVFIDDNFDNVQAAEKLGLNGIHFKSAAQLRNDLRAMNIAI